MKYPRFDSARQKAQFAKSVKQFQDIIKQRQMLVKSRFDFQETCSKELSKRFPQPTEKEPLPRAVRAALGKFHAEAKKARGGIPAKGRPTAVVAAPMDITSLINAMSGSYIMPHPVTFDIAEASFWQTPSPAGWTDAGQLGNEKSGYCDVGDAALDGPTVFAWNWTAFGFFSYFSLRGIGKPQTIEISTSYTMNYAWLEALSFGSQSWGEVIGMSYLDVAVEDSASSDSCELVHGISPRGNYHDGDIGVWNPCPYAEDRGHAVAFTTAFSRNTEHVVSIFETIGFYAIRHHRNDRCDAVANVGCAFNPVRVRISSII